MNLAPILDNSFSMDSNLITRYFKRINWDKVVSTVFNAIFLIIMLTILFWIINSIGKSLIRRGFKRARHSDKFDRGRTGTIYTLSLNIFHYCVLFFYFYAVLSVMGIPVGTLIAGAGILSVAIGLGAQGFVTDVVTGLFILLENQFAVGDQVTLGTVSGTVCAMGLRTTQIKGSDGTLYFIPNRSITTVSNKSRNDIQALINIRITAEMNIEKMEEIMDRVNKELVKEITNVTQPPVIVGVVDLGDGQLALQSSVLAVSGTQSQVKEKFLAAYLKAFNEAGIKLPRPSIIQSSQTAAKK